MVLWLLDPVLLLLGLKTATDVVGPAIEGTVGPITGPVDASLPTGDADNPAPLDSEATRNVRAKRAVLTLGLAAGAIAAPTIYAYSLKTKKRKKALTEKELMLGRSLENTSQQMTQLSLTALAAPALAIPLAYWLIEIGENFPPAKYEDGVMVSPPGIWSGRFGDRMQTLLTASVAAPMIQGIAGLASSAFTRGKGK